MRIGIFGAGIMADALGTRWVAAGHDVMIAGRTAEKAKALADKWGARAGSFHDVAEFADVALIAVLYQGMASTLAEIGEGLRGKVILDCNNPVETDGFTLATHPGRSMAQQIEQATGGKVVKAFNLCHARVWEMQPPMFDGRRLVVPYCGDHPEGHEPARELITDLGAEPLLVGDLRHAHHLEAMAAIVISLLFGGRDPHTVLNLVDNLPVAQVTSSS
jgi:predicted dinucleotide-binding enzyme